MRFKRLIADFLILVCYVGLIYATLPVMPRVTIFLLRTYGQRSVRIFTDSLVVSSLVLAVSFLYSRFKRKNFMAYIGLAAIIAIYAFILAYSTPIIQEKMHLIEYGFLSYLALRLFRDVRPRNAKYICVVLVVVTVGYFDEFIQKFIPNRVSELRDVYMNILSGLMALVLLRLLGYEDENISRD